MHDQLSYLPAADANVRADEVQDDCRQDLQDAFIPKQQQQ